MSVRVQILGGAEVYDCLIHDRYKVLAREQGIVIKHSPGNLGVHRVSFPAGTKHVVGEFQSTQGAYSADIFLLPNGNFWGKRLPIPDRPFRNLEPWERRRQEEATRVIQGVRDLERRK
jgi:hypothetical protein